MYDYWSPQKPTPDELEQKRRDTIELGPGSDRDKPYKSPEYWLTQEQLRKFIGVMRRFLDGNIGGRNDGQEQVVEVNDERS